MQFSLESLAALATIAGLIVSILALFQSRAWLALTSLCCCLSRSRGRLVREETASCGRHGVNRDRGSGH